MRTNPSPNSSSAGAELTPVLEWRARYVTVPQGKAAVAFGALSLLGAIPFFAQKLSRYDPSDANRLYLLMFGLIYIAGSLRLLFPPLAIRTYRLDETGLFVGHDEALPKIPWANIRRVRFSERAARLQIKALYRPTLVLPADEPTRAEAIAFLRSHLPETAFA